MDSPNPTGHSVIETRFATPGLFELVVERRNLGFTPGDCVAIHAASGKSRPYSIASGSDEEELRFVIRAMEGGEVSPWLMSRNPGDTIQLSPPFGWFRPGQEIGGALFVFIATGTGIAPFLSYATRVESRLWRAFTEYGASPMPSDIPTSGTGAQPGWPSPARMPEHITKAAQPNCWARFRKTPKPTIFAAASKTWSKRLANGCKSEAFPS